MVKTAVKVGTGVFVLSTIIGGTNVIRGSLLERTLTFCIAQPLVALHKVYDFGREAVKEHLPGESTAAPQENGKRDQKEGKAPSVKDVVPVPNETPRNGLAPSAKVTILLENVQSIDVTSAGRHPVVMQ